MWFQLALAYPTLLFALLAPAPVPATVLIHPYPTNDRFSCFRANPSCGRDPWWAERFELDDRRMARFSQLGAGLAADVRLAEPVNLLWQWSDGRSLLTDAAAHGVTILFDPSFPSNPAVYQPFDRSIRVNPRYGPMATWIVAGLLAHELQHAADHRAGSLEGPEPHFCFARERHAYHTERLYVRWLTGELVRQPVPLELINRRLPAVDREMAARLVMIANAPSLDQLVAHDYAQECGR